MSRPLTLWTASLLGLVQGGYMLFDGSHRLLTGRYFGSHVGPWAQAVESAGLESGAMAIPFVALGCAWLLSAALLLARLRGARAALIVLSVVSMWYLVFGTLISIIVLICVFSRSTRAALAGDGAASV